MGGISVRLLEDRLEHRRDHRPLGFRYFLVEVFREVGATALPRRVGQHFRYRVLDALMSVTGDKEDPAKSAGF